MLLIPSLKKKTKQSAIETLQDATILYLPLDVYSGRLQALVKIGEQVKKYQLIAASEGVFAAKLHAPVSGTITAFLEINGKAMIALQNDYLEEETPIHPVDVETLTLEGFQAILLNYGIQGAGGALFPTHLKYKVEHSNISTLIFNGVECEPYLSADVILMKEKAAELLKAAQVIQRLLGVQRVVFAIEKQHIGLKSILLNHAAMLNLIIEVKILPNTYPQGGELQLIRSVTKKEIPKGSVPSAHGIMVSNVGTLWAIYNAIFEGKPYTERIVTVSGNSATHTGNYLIKHGTPIAHILKETGNEWKVETQWVIVGGAMMGKPAHSKRTPIHKGTGGVLLLKKHPVSQHNCIKCGWCVDVCPQRLMPLELVRQNQLDNPTALIDLNLQDCIECGACAYVCPSEVPLMENIFEGKTKIVNN